MALTDTKTMESQIPFGLGLRLRENLLLTSVRFMNPKRFFFYLALALSLTSPGFAETWAYIGTYTKGASEGIYRSSLDLETGMLSAPVLAAKITSPSFVAIHPSGHYLYAVSEAGKEGSVSSFLIEEDGSLTLINQQPSGGTSPCHLSVDSDGRCLLVANYGGSCASFPLLADGSIGEAGSVIQHEGSSVDPKRQAGPHAHSINVDAANQRAFAADLGLDKILIYELDRDKGTLSVNDPAFLKTPPGSGPRHFSFHPGGKFAYANLEMSLEVATMSYDSETGALSLLETLSTVEEGTPSAGNSTAETLVHPSGKFVYVSNRGPNSIAAFAIDSETGKLTLIEREPTLGKTPRGFGIDPSGQFIVVGNQNSDNVIVLRIDPSTGKLEPTGSEITVGNPVNVRFLTR